MEVNIKEFNPVTPIATIQSEIHITSNPIREKSGTPTIKFTTSQNQLINWKIQGAAGGVGKLGKNYLKQTEITLPSGSYGERVFTTSSWITARTGTFNSGQATTIGFNLHKADNSNITPANVGKMYIAEGNADPETEGVELDIFQGGVSSKGDDNNPSVYHLLRFGDDGYGNMQQLKPNGNAAYIPIRCGTALYELKTNTVYSFARVGGDNDVEIQYSTGRGVRTVSINYVDTGLPAIPEGNSTTSESAQWCRMIASENFYTLQSGNTPIDCRAESYENCSAFAELDIGRYKVIAEAIISDATGLSTELLDDNTPYFMLLDNHNNKIISKTQIFQNSQLWYHEEYEFTLSDKTKLGLFFKAYFNQNLAFVRFMIVDYNTTAEAFDISSDYGQITGFSCWTPYSITLPIIISGESESTTITVNLGTDFLYDNDIISYTSTGINLPTYIGENIISVDSKIPPSEIFIQYYK